MTQEQVNYSTVTFDGKDFHFRRPVIALLRKVQGLGKYLDETKLQEAIENEEEYGELNKLWETFRKSAFSGSAVPPALEECELAEAVFAIASFFAFVGRPIDQRNVPLTSSASPIRLQPQSTMTTPSNSSSSNSPEETLPKQE